MDRDIPRDDLVNTFDPPKPTARWTLEEPAGNRMHGLWSSVDHGSQLPVDLTRVATLAQGRSGGCGAYAGASRAKQAFNAPRVAAEKIAYKPERSGTRVATAFAGAISATELRMTLPRAGVFNQHIAVWLKNRIAGYYDCTLLNHGESDFSTKYSILGFNASRVVAWITYNTDWGGPHPNADQDYEVWNLGSAAPVDPWDFIKDSSWTGQCEPAKPDAYVPAAQCTNRDLRNADCVRRPPPKLLAIVSRKLKRDSDGQSDCKDTSDDLTLSPLALYPTPKGMVSSTVLAHAMQACDDDVEVDRSALMPFLTDQGKTFMQSFISAEYTPRG